MKKNVGLSQGMVTEIKLGDVLKKYSESKEILSIDKYKMDPQTPLYNLAVGGSHTYYVNDYAVTGWPREDDFDYSRWMIKNV